MNRRVLSGILGLALLGSAASALAQGTEQMPPATSERTMQSDHPTMDSGSSEPMMQPDQPTMDSGSSEPTMQSDHPMMDSGSSEPMMQPGN